MNLRVAIYFHMLYPPIEDMKQDSFEDVGTDNNTQCASYPPGVMMSPMSNHRSTHNTPSPALIQILIHHPIIIMTVPSQLLYI